MPELTPNEAAERRVLRFKKHFNDEIKSRFGSQIVAVNAQGVVLSVSRSRIVIPWHWVIDFAYDFDDVNVRKFMEGF